MTERPCVIEDPTKVTTAELKEHLRMRQFNIPNLESLTRADTLDVFGRLAMPKPQRRCKNTAPESTPSVTPVATMPATKRCNTATPLDVDRMAVDCKRIRLNSLVSTGAPPMLRKTSSADQPMDMVVDIVESGHIERKRHKPITWP